MADQRAFIVLLHYRSLHGLRKKKDDPLLPLVFILYCKSMEIMFSETDVKKHIPIMWIWKDYMLLYMKT